MGAQTVRTARLAAGLSQQALAEAADVNYTTISDLERGKRRPTYTTARRVAQALHCAPEDLWETFGHSQPHEGDTLPRRLRLERGGISQRRVAQGAGVSLGVVQRAEDGKRLTPSNAKAIADYYEIDVADFQAPLLPSEEAVA